MNETCPTYPTEMDHDKALGGIYYVKPLPKPAGTFDFLVTIRFEIDAVIATNLLGETNPSQSVHNWLLTQHPKDDCDYSGNTSELRRELGAYLVEKEIGVKPPPAPPF